MLRARAALPEDAGPQTTLVLMAVKTRTKRSEPQRTDHSHFPASASQGTIQKDRSYAVLVTVLLLKHLSRWWLYSRYLLLINLVVLICLISIARDLTNPRLSDAIAIRNKKSATGWSPRALNFPYGKGNELFDHPSSIHEDALASENEDASAGALIGLVGIAEEINKRFSGATPLGAGKWSAVCPICGEQPVDDANEPERQLLIVVDSETRRFYARCFGDRCAENEVLQRVGIDLEHLGLRCTDVTPTLPTPAALLCKSNVETSVAMAVLEAYFPPDIDDLYHHDPDWVAFLQRFANKDPAFYSALLNLMTKQGWPRNSREAYLDGYNIERLQEGSGAFATEPLPLRRETTTPEEFPADALGPILIA